MPCNFKHEKILRGRGLGLIAGIDEAGRGPMAGPVVAAAVILPPTFRHKRLTDSKLLPAVLREAIYHELHAHDEIDWAVSVVDVGEIETLNILRAAHEAMRRAVAALKQTPEHVLIDGLPVRPFPVEQTALVKGDSLSWSIAAASVFAKVTRDRIMVEADALYPQYGFAAHKGYCTAQHLENLTLHGPCPLHRRSFSPVAQQTFRF